MKKIFFTFLVISFVCILFILYVTSLLSSTGSNIETIEINIPKNTSITKTVDILNKEGYLKPKFLFTTFIKLYSKYNKKFIYSGYYSLQVKQTNLEVIKMLFNGGYDLTVKVTIPEGSSYKEIEKILFTNVELDTLKYKELINSDSIKNLFGVPENHSIEGYILPETYFFYKHSSPDYIINKFLKIHKNFWLTLGIPPSNKISLNGIEFNKHSLLSLASIVEAETPLKEESATVAGLYLNRLRIGMKLQSDPTVQYAIGQKSRVLYKDLENPSAYNTYKYSGLPPGPINSPGKNAIKSTLNYEKNSYLYMVSFGDSSGKHRFSKNINEHNQNVSLYRKARKRG